MTVRLGIDQSYTSTGICIIDDVADGILGKPRILYWACITTTKDQDEPDRLIDVMRRALKISGEIHALVKQYSVDEVYIEGISMASRGDATRNLAILFGTILRVLTKLPKVIPPTTLKKFATGSGSSGKDAMVQAIEDNDPEAYKMIAHIPKTKGKYDLADAYHLAHYKE